MKHEEFFRKHPVFTRKELDRHLSLKGEAGPRTGESLLNYHKKAKHIILIRRGLYAVIPPGSEPDTYPVDPFLIAAKLTKDAILSHHTALEIHGHAYSMHKHFTYSASRPVSKITFRSHVFNGVQFPKALCRKGKENLGTVTVERAGLDISVTSLERTMVDVLAKPGISGSWEEIWRSLGSIEFFDLDKVVEYTLLLDNATTTAKVGFFLEQHRKSLMVEDAHLKPLHEQRPQQPHYLDQAKRKHGHLVHAWNLVVPADLLGQTWGEVL